MNKEANEVIKALGLEPHPEGGFFKETYRSSGKIPKAALGEDFAGDRNYCTAICFLLLPGNFSAFHRLRQDEIWHYYSGSPVYVHVIDKQGNYTRHTVGSDIKNGEVPQLTVRAGCWFASSVKEGSGYSLTGCTVSPGFDFADFELAKREELVKAYPQHEQIIRQLTRK